MLGPPPTSHTPLNSPNLHPPVKKQRAGGTPQKHSQPENGSNNSSDFAMKVDGAMSARRAELSRLREKQQRQKPKPATVTATEPPRSSQIPPRQAGRTTPAVPPPPVIPPRPDPLNHHRRTSDIFPEVTNKVPSSQLARNLDSTSFAAAPPDDAKTAAPGTSDALPSTPGDPGTAKPEDGPPPPSRPKSAPPQRPPLPVGSGPPQPAKQRSSSRPPPPGRPKPVQVPSTLPPASGGAENAPPMNPSISSPAPSSTSGAGAMMAPPFLPAGAPPPTHGHGHGPPPTIPHHSQGPPPTSIGASSLPPKDAKLHPSMVNTQDGATTVPPPARPASKKKPPPPHPVAATAPPTTTTTTAPPPISNGGIDHELDKSSSHSATSGTLNKVPSQSLDQSSSHSTMGAPPILPPHHPLSPRSAPPIIMPGPSLAPPGHRQGELPPPTMWMPSPMAGVPSQQPMMPGPAAAPAARYATITPVATLVTSTSSLPGGDGLGLIGGSDHSTTMAAASVQVMEHAIGGDNTIPSTSRSEAKELSVELRMQMELTQLQREKAELHRRIIDLEDRLEESTRAGTAVAVEALQQVLAVSESKGDHAAVGWARECVSSGRMIEAVAVPMSPRLRHTPIHPKPKRSLHQQHEELAPDQLLAAVECVEHEYVAEIATFIVRRPFDLAEERDLWFRTGQLHSKKYAELATVTQVESIEVAAIITADQSILSVLGGGSQPWFVKHEQPNGVWREFDSDAVRNGESLGNVTMVDADGREILFSLDDVLEGANAVRETYCWSVISKAVELKSPKDLIALGGDEGPPPSTITSTAKVATQEKGVGTEDLPIPTPKPASAPEGSSDILSAFFGMFLSGILSLLYNVLIGFPLRVISNTLAISLSVILLSVAWLYMADEHLVPINYLYNRPGIM